MKASGNDYDRWVYHALHEPKVVKASEAKLLYKRGWRDSPEPKAIFRGIRGKWYWLILWFRSLKEKESKHWNSVVIITLLVTILIGIGTIATMLFIHYDTKQNNAAQPNIQQIQK